jgi:hypothetical protein
LLNVYPSKKKFPKNGRISEVRSQAAFSSSLTRHFGFWSERSVPSADINNFIL